MTESADEDLFYKRSRFSSRLPAACLYTRSHFWLREREPRVWRIGLTRFATRMLGEIVEFDFEVEPAQEIGVAQVIGWIEGFKAVSDVFCVASGVFDGANPKTVDDPSIIGSSPYDNGWIYAVRGEPDPEAVDVHGYVAHLDATIDKMLERPWETPEIGS